MFAWMLLDCVLLRELSGLDGEENVGDPEYFEEQQFQSDFASQGKYNMGLSLMPTHFN